MLQGRRARTGSKQPAMSCEKAILGRWHAPRHILAAPSSGCPCARAPSSPFASARLPGQRSLEAACAQSANSGSAPRVLILFRFDFGMVCVCAFLSFSFGPHRSLYRESGRRISGYSTGALISARQTALCPLARHLAAFVFTVCCKTVCALRFAFGCHDTPRGPRWWSRRWCCRRTGRRNELATHGSSSR